jgi:hypothetical protein
MAITKAVLRNRVLLHLTVLGAGETASAEDATLVDDAIDGENAVLQALGVSTWGTDAIPDEVAEPLKRYMAGRLASSFGKGDGEALAQIALGDLRSITAVLDSTGEPVPSVYF